jgi:hypothetical protein
MKLVETLAAEPQLILQVPVVGRRRAITQGLAAGSAGSAHGHARRSSSAFNDAGSVFRSIKVPRPGPGP